MMDFVVIGILVLLVGGAVAYIIREKRRGVRCIGCPHAGTCGKQHDSCGHVQ